MFDNIMLGIFGFLAISFAVIMLYAAVDPHFEKKSKKA